MLTAVRLAVAMLFGAITLPVLKYLICGDGSPVDVIRVFISLVGAACGFMFEMARRAIRRGRVNL